MAVRYSGDVEVRMTWDPATRTVRGSVRDLVRGRRPWHGQRAARRPDSGAYDRHARAFIQSAERELGRKLPCDRGRLGTIRVRRVFQAPCPVGYIEI